jgi:hypothetical protein
MKIYTPVDWDTPFMYLSISYAIKNLSKYIDCEVILYDYKDWKRRQIDKDSDQCIIILQAGQIPHGNWTVASLKEYYPNSKIVTLCGDTVWWMVNGGQEIHDQHLVDLNLEPMPQCVEWMQQKGWNTEQYLWTCSEINIEELEQICPQDEINWSIKEIDLIGVYGPWSISNPGYRHDMVKWLTENGCTFTQGGGSGHQDNDLIKIYNAYQKSWLNLGTTSHNNSAISRMGCMKGWRDWISPFLNCLLIYDDHQNIQEAYNKNNIIPTYKYDNFNEIKDLVMFYKNNTNIYHEKLLAQRKWAKDNTIDKQLVSLMLKYNIINKDTIREYR